MRTWFSSRPRFFVESEYHVLRVLDTWTGTSVTIQDNMTVDQCKTLSEFLSLHRENQVEIEVLGFGLLTAEIMTQVFDVEVLRTRKCQRL